MNQLDNSPHNVGNTETDVKGIFETLARVNVNDRIETKNGLNYLSWSWAIHELMTRYPESFWEVQRFGDDNLPYQCLGLDAGAIVEVAVTVVDGEKRVTRSCILPILDYRNKPVKSPTAWDVNTSIMRATAKAIAYHGLGLYIYQGEDLPDSYDPHSDLEETIARMPEHKRTYIYDYFRSLEIFNEDSTPDKDNYIAKIPLPLARRALENTAGLLEKAMEYNASLDLDTEGTSDE